MIKEDIKKWTEFETDGVIIVVSEVSGDGFLWLTYEGDTSGINATNQIALAPEEAKAIFQWYQDILSKRDGASEPKANDAKAGGI